MSPSDTKTNTRKHKKRSFTHLVPDIPKPQPIPKKADGFVLHGSFTLHTEVPKQLEKVNILVMKPNLSDGNHLGRFLRYDTTPCVRVTSHIDITSNRPKCVCSHVNRTIDRDTSEMVDGKWQDREGPSLCDELEKIRKDAPRMQETFLEENGLTAAYVKENEITEAGYCVGGGPVVKGVFNPSRSGFISTENSLMTEFSMTAVFMCVGGSEIRFVRRWTKCRDRNTWMFDAENEVEVVQSQNTPWPDADESDSEEEGYPEYLDKTPFSN